MRLILYPTGLFVFTFLLQLFFIIITERKRKTDKEVDCNNKRIVKKALIALVISLFLAVALLEFFLFGFAVLSGLREGH